MFMLLGVSFALFALLSAYSFLKRKEPGYAVLMALFLVLSGIAFLQDYQFEQLKQRLDKEKEILKTKEQEMDLVTQQLEHAAKIAMLEIENYANARKRDIDRGAETPRLAALMVEKYALGIIKGLEIVAHSFDRAIPQLPRTLDEVILEICPEFHAETKARYEAMPADLVYNKEIE